MPPVPLGIEGITDEDQAYSGSCFSEVEAAIFANPYQKTWAAAGEPAMPVYEVTLANMLRGLRPSRWDFAFRRATERAVDWPPTCVGDRTAKASAACCIRTAFA